MQKKLIIHFKTASDNTKLLHTLRCFARFARLIHILERHLAFVRRFGLGVARNIGTSMTQLDSSRPAVDFRPNDAVRGFQKPLFQSNLFLKPFKKIRKNFENAKKLIIHPKTASDNTKLLHTLRCFARFARLIHILERHLVFVRRFGLGVARNIGASMTQLDPFRPAVDFRPNDTVGGFKKPLIQSNLFLKPFKKIHQEKIWECKKNS